MHTIDSKQLAAALRLAKLTQSARNAFPALTCAHLDAGILTATDLEITVRIPVDYTGPAVLVPIKTTLAALKGAKGSIRFELDPANDVLHVGSAAIRSSVDVTEYPRFDVFDPAARFELGDVDRAALQSTASVASADPSRPILTGVLHVVAGGTASWVATDSYRLDLTRYPSAAKDSHNLIPAHAIRAAFKVKALDVVEYTPREARFAGPGGSVTARTIDGDFPRYESLLPKTCTGTMTVDAATLHAAAVDAAAFSKETNPLRLENLSTRGALLSRQIVDVGSWTRAVGTPAAKGPAIAFNAKYLADGLAGIAGDVVLSVVDCLKPATLTTASRPGWLYLIMPVNVNYQGYRDTNIAGGLPEPVADVVADVEPVADVVADVEPVADVVADVEPVADVVADVEPVADVVADVEPVADVVADVEPVADVVNLSRWSIAEMRSNLWDLVSRGVLSIEEAMRRLDVGYAYAATI
jgi:DNA polymerase III sliding clamp (beta) subunit (PCNA family)